MTENKRFTFGAVGPNIAMISDNDQPLNVREIVDLLNTLHEENNNLKQALWEAETEYIHERYYDNPIREEESINELKEDFKRGYWNDCEKI